VSFHAAKLVIISNNCPPLRKSEIEYYAMLAKGTAVHHYSGSTPARRPPPAQQIRAVLARISPRFPEWLVACALCAQTQLCVPFRPTAAPIPHPVPRLPVSLLLVSLGSRLVGLAGLRCCSGFHDYY
jgi:hypothetical protein